MSVPKLSELTPSEKRVLIAETCGWTKDNAVNEQAYWIKHGEISFASELPPYLTSLDAMHGAEMSIPRHDRGSYTMALRRIIQRDCNSAEYYVDGCDRAQLIADFWFYHATAAQRADAFLITTGKAIA